MGELVQIENTEYCDTRFKGRIWVKDKKKVKLGVNQVMTFLLPSLAEPVVSIDENGKLHIYNFGRGSFIEWKGFTIIYRATEFNQHNYVSRVLVEFAQLSHRKAS